MPDNTLINNGYRKLKVIDVAIGGSYEDLASKRGLFNASAASNIDNLVKQGVYYATVSGFTGESKIVVLNSTEGIPTQLLFNNNKQYIRNKTESGWSDWNESLDTFSNQTISGSKTFTQDVTVTGRVYCNAFVLTSDKRLKNNITPYSINNLSELKCYKYVLETDGKEYIGLIEQDVKKALPEAVHEDKEGYLSIDYSALTACLCSYVNQLEKRIAYLESKVG